MIMRTLYTYPRVLRGRERGCVEPAASPHGPGCLAGPSVWSSAAPVHPPRQRVDIERKRERVTTN